MTPYRKLSHWTLGRLSGYPLCCRIQFYLRNAMVRLIGIKRVGYVTKKIGNKIGFITCPLHNVLIRLGLYKVTKYSCQECSWVQIKPGRCGVSKYHTEIYFETVNFYMTQMSELGEVRIKYSGLQSRQILDRITGKR